MRFHSDINSSTANRKLYSRLCRDPLIISKMMKRERANSDDVVLLLDKEIIVYF